MKQIQTGLLVLVLASFAFGSALLSGAVDPDEIRKGNESITAREIRAHVHFLASDLLEGRGNGEAGLEIAAAYIASQFADAGLQPVGEDGTYFQHFDLRRSVLDQPNVLTITTSHGVSEFRFEEDFMSLSFTADTVVTAPVVFAGYGISAPEYNYDDYRNIDVEGKMVLMLSHEPQETDSSSIFRGIRRTRHARLSEKAETAREHGAVGMLVVTDPLNHDSHDVPSVAEAWDIYRPVSQHRMSLASVPRENDMPVVQITLETARDLLAGTGKNLTALQKVIDATLEPRSFAIKDKSVTLQTSVRDALISVKNVAGLVPGKGQETVVIGAHYDHEGKDGEKIYNGADDDASGTTGLLEIAEAFMLNDKRPKRNVLFLAFAAEEKGLHGSKYYAANPLMPLQQTVAMIQMDMIGRNEDTASIPARYRRGLPVVTPEQGRNLVHVIGSTYSPDVRRFSDRANEEVGLNLDYTYDNVQALVKRSDHWHFLEKGIPSLFFFNGFHPDYHQPSDTADKIDVNKLQRVLKLVYLTAWDLATTSELPRYEPPEN